MVILKLSEFSFKKFKMNLFVIVLVCLIQTSFSEPPQRVIVGTQNKTIEIQSDCEMFQILTNYKHISIEIKNLKNVDVVHITDKVLDSCNINECQEDSNICQSKLFYYNYSNSFEFLL